MSKTMAEVLAEHGFRKWGDRLDDFNWVVCLCGATIGGSEKWQTLLAQHQTAALTAAGFGLVAEAQARAYDKGYTHGRHDEKYHPPMSLSGTPRLEKSRRNPYRALRQR